MNATVALRAMEPEDLDMLYRIENDPQLWDVSTTNVPYSRYALHDYVAHASSDIYADRQVRLIIENAQHKAVGIVDLVNFDPRHQRAEVGIVVERQYRRRGYALAALHALHDYVRHAVHLHQTYAIIDTSHVAARRLFRNAGYTEVATLPQWFSTAEGFQDAVVMVRCNQ